MSSSRSSSTTPDIVERVNSLRARRELASRSLTHFCRLSSGNKFKTPPHLKLLISKLEAVERGEIKRLIVSMPPRHGKSWTCSRFFPAWFLGRNPDKSLILASYGASFAKKWGAKAKSLVGSFAGQIWNVHLSQDTKAKDEWEIENHEGGMKTAGVGGDITGRGADILIIDDPVKNAEEANSETYRDKAWDWYDTTAHSRLEPGAAIIVIMTRWHEDDLAGRLLREEQEAIEAGEEPEGWELVVFPAIAEEGDKDILGRNPGEALWPERFAADCKKFQRIKKRRPYVWSALYQQRPTFPEGNLFKSKNFRFYRILDGKPLGIDEPVFEYQGTRCLVRHMHVFTTTDPAFSEAESADWTVTCVWGFYADLLWLIDLQRGRFSKLELVKTFKDIREKYGITRNWIEEGAFKKGAKTIEFLRSKGIVVSELGREHGVDKEKYARADSAQGWFEEGRVLFPEYSSWLYLMIDELLEFPRGSHDDQVDAVSYGVLAAPWDMHEESLTFANANDTLGGHGYHLSQPSIL